MGYTMSKTILLTVCLFLAIMATANAKTVNLAWDPSPSTNVAGYKIYYKEGSSSLNFNGSGANEGSSPIDVGKTLSSSLTGLPDTETHYFAVTAYDTSGNESTPSNIVDSSPVIIAINHPPVLAAIGSKTINEGTNLSFTLSATDPDGDSLTYSATGLPSGAIFNAATRTFTWTPRNTHAGNYTVSFSVSDGSLNDAETVAISVGNVNRPPVLTAIGSKTINVGTNLSFTLSAIDPDGDSLTYSAIGLPKGAPFNAATRMFTWTPGNTQAGNYNVSFSVSDGSLIVTEPVAIIVGSVNRPPVLTAIGSKTINVGTNLSFTLSATDPDGDDLTYSATDLPSGATFNAATRMFTWTPGNTQAGSYNVNFSVSDGSLNDAETVAISVDASVPDGLSLPLSENGLPGVEREDGGDDSNNYVNGMPKGDLKYIFRVVLRDTSGGELPSVILILNGYAYPMVREAGDIETGATFSFTTRLGPVTSHRFYFQTRDSEGKILSEFPAQEDLQGPQVEFLNGKNMVGARGDINPLQLSSTDAIGTTQSFRWIPSEKKNGSYARIDNGGPVILGEGYVIKRTTDSFLPSMERFGENRALTSEISVKKGWNLIANPYGGNVPLSKVLIQDGGSEPISWVEAVSRQMIVDGSYYYTGKDWGDDTVFESSDGEQGAILIPGIGYWIYVNSENEPVSLIIPKPQQ